MNILGTVRKLIPAFTFFIFSFPATSSSKDETWFSSSLGSGHIPHRVPPPPPKKKHLPAFSGPRQTTLLDLGCEWDSEPTNRMKTEC